MCIVTDTREQTPWTFSAACDVEIRKLDYGDYSVAGYESRWAIERKSLADLVGSLTAGRDRFLRELARLRRYEQSAIIVEATVADVRAHDYRSRIPPATLMANVAMLRSRYCPVYFEGTPALAALAAEDLMYRWLRDEQAMRGGASAVGAHSQQQASGGVQ
jgi:ERCC4-type nuclease